MKAVTLPHWNKYVLFLIVLIALLARPDSVLVSEGNFPPPPDPEGSG